MRRILSILMFLAVSIKAATVVISGNAKLSGSVGFGDADLISYQLRLAAAGDSITPRQLTSISTFIAAAKSNAYWSQLLEVGTFTGNSLTGALVKLKAAPIAPLSLWNSNFVAADYDSLSGVQGGSGKSFDTGFNLATNGSFAIGISVFVNDEFRPYQNADWVGQDNSVGQPYCALAFGAGHPMNYGGYLGSSAAFVSPTAGFIGAVGKGFNHLIRRSGTNLAYFFDGGPGTTYTVSENFTLNNVRVKVQAGGTASGVAANSSTNILSFYSIDNGSMTDAQCALFATDVIQLQRDLLRFVPVQSKLKSTFLIGQSLASGSMGAPTLTTNAIYHAKGFTQNSPTHLSTLLMKNFVPYVEPATETIAGGFLNLIGAAWRTSHPSDASEDPLLSNWSSGAADYSQLKKGTDPYNESSNAVYQANIIAGDYATNFLVSGILAIHGESDNHSATYQADIEQWQLDYQTDIQAITGQSDSVPIFHTQISAWTSQGGAATSASPYAVLAAYKANPTKTILVGPKYFLQYADGLHLTNTSYRWLGEYYGKAWATVVSQGGRWTPLYPTNISRSGAMIDLIFATQSNLAIDAEAVSDPGNYGFEYFDNSASATISSVTLLAGTPTNTVRVTLTADPIGSGKKIRYAFTGIAGNNGGPTTGPRGCLRNTDATFTSNYGNTLYDWCVHFDEPCP